MQEFQLILDMRVLFAARTQTNNSRVENGMYVAIFIRPSHYSHISTSNMTGFLCSILLPIKGFAKFRQALQSNKSIFELWFRIPFYKTEHIIKDFVQGKSQKLCFVFHGTIQCTSTGGRTQQHNFSIMQFFHLFQHSNGLTYSCTGPRGI